MSLENQFDVIVVAKFFQGPWLAAELQKKNFKVLLIDLSSHLGAWTPEDVEGPFGHFKTDSFKQSYLEKRNNEEVDHEVENGFTIWRKSGPLEFKGPLSGFYLENLGLDQKTAELFTRTTRAEKINQEDYLQHYDRFWPLSLSQQLAATRFMSLQQSFQMASGLPFQSPFFIRWPSRNSLEKSMQWLKTMNVRTTTTTNIIDLSLGPGKTIQGVELKGELSGLVKSENLIWCLTSEETYFYNSLIGQEIFPQGSLECQWSWLRYRLKYESNDRTHALPLHFCTVENESLSMTHENLILWQKTASSELIDAWVRLPSVQRFNKSYLAKHGEKIKNILQQRVEMPSVEVHSFPQEYYYTYHQMGPSQHPMYSKEADSQKRRKSGYKNISLYSNETVEHYSDEFFQSAQQGIIDQLIREREIKELKKQKELQK